MRSWISVIVVSVAAALWMGCEEAEEVFDCASICETYEDCAGELGEDVDLTECIDDCEAEADRDEEFAEAASDCEACLDENQSCAENFPCADECSGVVPDVIF